MAKLIRRPLLLTFQIKQIQCKMFSTVKTSYILTSTIQKFSEGNLVKMSSLLGTFATIRIFSTVKNIVNTSVDPAMKSVPIKKLFKEYQNDIDTFKENKPEVYKVLNYIMNSDVKVMKAQADTIGVKFSFTQGRLMVQGNKVQLKDSGIKTGRFSKARYGEDSEESRILKAFLDLKNEVQIDDEKQLIRDFESLYLKHRWTYNIFGCYLSKYLETPRLPFKVFEQIMLPILYKFGKFSNAEDDFILKHIESNNGMYDLDYLKHKLMRPNDVIYPRIEFLSGNPSPKSVDKFTLGEDIMITKYVFNNKIPKDIDEIKEIMCRKISQINKNIF